MEAETTKKPRRAPRKKAVARTEVEAKPKRAPRARKVKVAEEVSVPATQEEAREPARPYLFSVGRRKEAVARVKLYRSGKGVIEVNNRPFTTYFPYFALHETVLAPLRAVGQADKVDIEAKVEGGGMTGQAEAVRLGIARSLIQLNPTFRVSLKRLNFLHRDPRVKERKKYGLKKARRAPQWAKR